MPFWTLPLKIIGFLAVYLSLDMPRALALSSPSPTASGAGEQGPNTPLPPLPTINSVQFDHLENENFVVLKTQNGSLLPKPIKTDLFDLTYIGTLRAAENGAPYFLFSGKPCRNCLDDRTIYALRPAGGKPTAFVYPGKIFEPRSRAILIESRAFFGKCLPRRGDLYIVFQKERIDRRAHLQASVLIAEAGKDFFAETLIERHLPNLRTTLQMVKQKTCREIEGRNRLMLSKPLDLHPHADVNTEDSEEEEDNESNASPILGDQQ